MPKLKTHSGAKKRFNLTKTGKVKRARAYKSHILTKKTTKRTRHLRATAYADMTNVDAIKKKRNDDAQEKKRYPEAGKGLLGFQVQALQDGQAAGHEVRQLRFCWPQAEEA